MHSCPDCGLAHDEPIIEAPAEQIITEPPTSDNDVKIAKIEAEASVEREKIWTEQRGLDLEHEVGELRGELRGMREVLDRVAPEPGPEPEPVPVVVEPPAPGPEPEVPLPPPAPGPGPEAKKQRGWWDDYK